MTITQEGKTMSVIQLAIELRNAGWRENRRVLILAARYYLGIDTQEEIRRYLPAEKVEYIVQMR